MAPVAVSWLRSTRSSRSLIGRGLRGPCDLEGRHSGHTVIEAFLDSTTVDHVFDAGDGQRRLGHVGGDDTQSGSRRRGPEHLQAGKTSPPARVRIYITSSPSPSGDIQLTLACCSGANREYRGRTYMGMDGSAFSSEGTEHGRDSEDTRLKHHTAFVEVVTTRTGIIGVVSDVQI